VHRIEHEAHWFPQHKITITDNKTFVCVIWNIGKRYRVLTDWDNISALATFSSSNCFNFLNMHWLIAIALFKVRLRLCWSGEVNKLMEEDILMAFVKY
jgi:hypothetical protein